jgi:hypothetical protein
VSGTGGHDEEFLRSAGLAMQGAGGNGALDALGWWDVLPHLDDPDARAATFTAFRAQGRELADSVALGALLAQPFVERSGGEPGTAVATIRRETKDRGPVWTALGDLDGRRLLLDEPGRGVHVVDLDSVQLHPVDIAGHLTVQEVSVDVAARTPEIDEHDDLGAVRARSTCLGRVAAAAEILGAAERVVELAVDYAGDREQFGQPIGTFQALRHLLAWASTDCTAIDRVVGQAVTQLDRPPERYDEVVKALAGRNGRRACERALQAFGGIGFTAEHPHHHFHSRVLLLDALLGSSAELTHNLGTWLRTSDHDPGYAASVVTVG